MKSLLITVMLMLLLSLNVAYAANSAAQDIKELQEVFSKNGMKDAVVDTTPIKGLYEVRGGKQTLYISHDKPYMIVGKLVISDALPDIGSGGIQNISSESIDPFNTEQVQAIMQLEKKFRKVPMIKATPIDGIYEVREVGAINVRYMNKDGRYEFKGDLHNVKENRNLTQKAQSMGRLMNLEFNVPNEEDMLIYEPEGETRHTITVFTDIHCSYCQRLHKEMDQYLKAGIRVRYLLTPYRGQKSYIDAESVWCSRDRNKTMDKAQKGEQIKTKSCQHPIEKHLSTARSIEIKGTPAILLEDGQLVAGYVPASKIIQYFK